jgi:peptide deformylase
MAILSVARMGHPVLRQVAAPVTADMLESAAFQRLCDDLLETMAEYDGVGLAAPQVRASVRLVVFEIDDELGPIFLVNPVVTPVGGERRSAYEGCLSLPDLRGRVERWQHVRVEAVDRHGEPIIFEARGWAARVVQHECDHLDGVLYIDRAEPRSMSFLKEYRRHGPPVGGDEE